MTDPSNPTPNPNWNDPNRPDLNKGQPGPAQPDPSQFGQQQYGQPQYGQQPGQPYGASGQPGPDYGQQPPNWGQQPGVPAGGLGPGQPYGAPGVGGPGMPQDVNIGEALSWAWAQFKANPGPMVVPGLLFLVLVVVLTGASFGLLRPSTDTVSYGSGATLQVSTGPGAGAVAAFILVYLVFIVAAFYITASMIAGALRVADGQPVTMSTFLKPERIGAVIGTSIVVGLIVSIGMALCIIPGLIAIFLLQFAVFFVVDKRVSLGEALSASSGLARVSVSNSLLTLVVSYAITYVGMLLCYVGLIATMPIGQLFYAHCFRRMTGGYVAPAPQ